MQKLLMIFLLFWVSLMANEAEDIIAKLDQNLRGKNIYIEMSMKITSMGHTRTMKMKNWAQGTKRSFVKTTYPPKDKGITFLSLDKQMWQYVPKIERVIKIPASMMLQNWMGSDITNDDVVRQSSLVDDYIPRILKKDGDIVTMELTAKEEAAVVWSKIVSKIDTSTYTSKEDLFYDEEDKVVRVFSYDKVKKVSGYFIATYWRVQGVDKKDSFTEIFIDDVKYDIEISDQYFRKSALKRFSR